MQRQFALRVSSALDKKCCCTGRKPVHRVDVSDDIVGRRVVVDHQPSRHRLQLQETFPEILPLGLLQDCWQRGREWSRRSAARRVGILSLLLL